MTGLRPDNVACTTLTVSPEFTGEEVPRPTTLSVRVHHFYSLGDSACTLGLLSHQGPLLGSV